MPEKRTKRDKASYSGTDEVSLEDSQAYETPSLTQITQEEPQVLFSVTNEAYGVVKDTTREEIPPQSIFLEHNVAYGETKPSNEQQPVHIVYETPLQQEEEYSNTEYEDIDDYI